MKDRVKAHVKKHKTVYCCAATGVVFAGITCLIMRSNIAQGGMGRSIAQGGMTNTASFNFSNKPTVKLTTVIEREGRGHPGWPVRNLETKRIFLSQREAANALNLPEGLISGHLNGRFPDVDGLHFERVNLA